MFDPQRKSGNVIANPNQILLWLIEQRRGGNITKEKQPIIFFSVPFDMLKSSRKLGAICVSEC